MTFLPSLSLLQKLLQASASASHSYNAICELKSGQDKTLTKVEKIESLVISLQKNMQALMEMKETERHDAVVAERQRKENMVTSLMSRTVPNSNAKSTNVAKRKANRSKVSCWGGVLFV